MQLGLLKRRAAKISSINLIAKTLLSEEARVMPGLNFTCDGNVTSLLLAVDVRTAVNTIIQYPQLQVWEPSTTLPGFYTRGDHQNIRLSAGDDFSPDGVLGYKLNPPISFQNGDVLGVWQPASSSSVVRMFYAKDPGAPVTERREHRSDPIPTVLINPLSTVTKVSNQSVLLSLTTGKILPQ